MYTVPEAFSGLSNQNTVLIAGMFVLSAAFGKTSPLGRIQDKMVALKGKNGLVLLVAIYAVIILFACFLPTTAEMTMMLMFLVALGRRRRYHSLQDDHPHPCHDQHLGSEDSSGYRSHHLRQHQRVL